MPKKKRKSRSHAVKRLVLILENDGGVLRRAEVNYRLGDDPQEALSNAAIAEIECWTLCAGDTIKIHDEDYPEQQT
jgi:hypothetical protein